MKFESVGLMDGFMERTYAYELYHQLRKFQDDLKYDNYFTIHAEPQKARTEFFLRILNRLRKENLGNENDEDFQKRVMPDLLVHAPGNINENIAVIEIELEKETSINDKGIKKDIRVLKEFINGGDGVVGYYKGILLLYSPRSDCIDEETVKGRYSEIIKGTIGRHWRKYAPAIYLIWHPAPKIKPRYIDWTS